MRAFLRRLEGEPIETWLGYVAAQGVAQHFTGYSTSPLADDVPTMAAVWAVAYALAGIGMLLGLGLGRREIETGALTVFIGGVLVNAFATAVVLGLSPQALFAYSALGSLIAALLIRLRRLLHGEVTVRIIEENQ